MLIQVRRYITQAEISRRTGASKKTVVRWFDGTPVRAIYLSPMLKMLEHIRDHIVDTPHSIHQWQLIVDRFKERYAAQLENML
jgi:hypothetical protein